MDRSIDVQANGQKHLPIASDHASDSPTGCTLCEQFSLEPVSHETVIGYLQTLSVKKVTGCDSSIYSVHSQSDVCFHFGLSVELSVGLSLG